jgi:hypothetical protein
MGTSVFRCVAYLLSKMAVKIVMPTIPPRAQALMLIVPAVPRRKEGTERARATTAKDFVSQVFVRASGKEGGLHTWNNSGDSCCNAEQG